MNTQAVEFIQSTGASSLAAILDALQDGAALDALGVTDADQPVVEEAHDLVSGWLAAGHTTLDQVA